MNTKLYAGNLADTTSEGDLQVQDMMNDESKATQPQACTRPAWKEIVMKYQQPALGPGLWQVVNTLVPYAALWYLMYRSQKANDLLGFITGVLTFTPYYHWRWEHAVHHATSGDLDRRGTGDIWTLTVQEYLESSGWKRFAYRLARNPFVLFVVAPLYVLLVKHRFPKSDASQRDRHSVYW